MFNFLFFSEFYVRSGQLSPIPLRPTFHSYFWKSISGEYHMYQFILLQYDYLCKTSLKANVATEEGKDRNEMWTLNKKIKLEQLYKVGSKS